MGNGHARDVHTKERGEIDQGSHRNGAQGNAKWHERMPEMRKIPHRAGNIKRRELNNNCGEKDAEKERIGNAEWGGYVSEIRYGG